METTYKLHVRLGQAEFDAEGPEETIKEQFERFLAAVMTSQVQPTADVKRLQEETLSPPVSAGIDATILQRAFAVDQRGIVSLRVLPRTPTRIPDAILLILYGFRVLQDLPDVPVIKLTTALRQSGVSVERIDRAIGPYADRITKGGAKSGGRYGLNNPGVAEAEELLRTMLT